MVKYLIFDSGSIINITQNCLVSMFRELSKVFQGEFLITSGVKREVIDTPLKIKKFGWGAIRIQNILDEEIIRLAEEEKICSPNELEEKTREVLNLTNNALFVNGRAVHLIDLGEAECLALSLLLTKRGIENAVVIDERTARMLCENPEYLKKIMESKLEARIKVKQENIREFTKIKVLRSTEMAYMAFKKGVIDRNRTKLEAILYALKFGGCSISEKEVKAMSQL